MMIEFKKFKGLLPQCLRKIEFEVDSKQIERLKNMIDPELLLNLICTLRKLNILKKEVEERLEIECEK